jgi:hypothetical protein
MKTIKIDELKKIANHLLACDEVSDEFRNGVASLLEDALRTANAYKGYNFFDWLDTGFHAWKNAGEPDFPEKDKFLGNRTKRIYY